MTDNLPMGFAAGTAQAGFKKKGRYDLGLIYSTLPCKLAALFTRNIFCAAPVKICREILASGKDVRAVVANSGQANSCTGEEGMQNGYLVQKLIAQDLHILPQEVLLISTGVIGDQLKMDKWKKHLPELVEDLGKKDAEGFTRAFMTTDAFPKFATENIELSQGAVRLTVMAKGAGMICPNMATMLCVVLTDCALEREAWQQMFNDAVNNTFNRVTVDGDTSTNDTILGLANGASGVMAQSTADHARLAEALTAILKKTAIMLVKDGEGAKRIMEITVTGAASENEAEQAARAIGNSQLVKTAIYGGDANWGRIVNAVGYSGITASPEKVGLKLCGIERFRQGQPVNNELESELAKKLQEPVIEIVVDLGNGPCEYTLYASDLGHEYVTLNSDYRS